MATTKKRKKRRGAKKMSAATKRLLAGARGEGRAVKKRAKSGSKKMSRALAKGGSSKLSARVTQLERTARQLEVNDRRLATGLIEIARVVDHHGRKWAALEGALGQRFGGEAPPRRLGGGRS